MLVMLLVLELEVVLERLPGSEALATEFAIEAERPASLPMSFLVLRERDPAMADYVIINKPFKAQTLAKFANGSASHRSLIGIGDRYKVACGGILEKEPFFLYLPLRNLLWTIP